MSLQLILTAAAVFLVSGLPFPKRVSAALMAAGGAVGLAGLVLASGDVLPARLTAGLHFSWGTFSAAADAISVVFLLPVFTLPALGAVLGAARNERGRFFHGALAAAMVLVVVARDGAFFLVAWELMALSAYFAAAAEARDEETRRAGWGYLVATHAGTLLLFAAFSLWRTATGSFALEPSASIPRAAAGGVFVLALVGFGFKAGLIPLHSWLPDFYSRSSGRTAGVLSGAMSKMGVYGLVRITFLLPPPETWQGAVLLSVGAATAVGGVALAAGQNNLKRLLAYSSVENVGIIAAGLGLALLGRGLNRHDWIVLGLAGALFHVWNHGLFKSLLFFLSGEVERETGTAEMDRLGGLAARMPAAAVLFAVGAVAIAGLPPLNGFASELAIYLGLFRTIAAEGAPALPGASVAAAALALAGALALAAFVKAFSATFLGAARTGAVLRAGKLPAGAAIPLLILAAACAVLGAVPRLAVPLLDRAAETWASGRLPSFGELAPLGAIGAVAPALIAAAVAAACLALAPRLKRAARPATWDCGYAAPTARMQYTGSSFGASLVSLFRHVLRPRRLRPEVTGLFPSGTEHAHEVPDAVRERITAPASAALARLLPHARRFQQGQTHLYVLYIVVFLAALFLSGGVR